VKKRFSILLPLLDLILWVSLIAVPTTLLFFNLRQIAHHSPTADIGDSTIRLSIPPDRFLAVAVYGATIHTAHAITAINLPGIVIEILISFGTSWPATWHPEGLLFDTWRAISFPFFCLPFWWLIGRYADTFFSLRRLHWTYLLLGSVLSTIFIVMFLGLRFGMSAAERNESDMSWVFAGIGLWAMLFALAPLAWLRQRRSRVST
jgi:hypothetical protein